MCKILVTILKPGDKERVRVEIFPLDRFTTEQEGNVTSERSKILLPYVFLWWDPPAAE